MPRLRLTLAGAALALALLGAGCAGGAHDRPPPASAGPATTTSAAAAPATTGRPATSSGSPPPASAATSTGAPAGTANPTAGPTAPPSPVVGSDWPTYHRTNDRDGVAVGAVRPGALGRRWEQPVDGAVYGQPLAVGGMVIAATENDTVYAFDQGTGQARWRSHLAEPVLSSALPCGNISPLGITGTPAYDAATGAVFVVTESTGGVHNLVALDARTGATRFVRNLDVGGRDRSAQQQRGAVTVANGRVYAAFGGLYGDCGNYVGYVTAARTDGSGTVARYQVPTAREGGIWAPPGPSIGPDGSVFVSVGNGAATSGAYDGSDAVLRLSPDLASRLDFFAPRTWATENGTDADLGSTSPILLPSGMAVIAGKSGTVYLLDAGHLGGIGGEVATLRGCTGYGGMAADGNAVFIPCAQGLARVDVAGRALHAGWHAPSSITGSPVVGGGAVWALDTNGGALVALDEATGATLATVPVGSVTRFASPTVVGASAFVGTTRSVVAVSVTR